MRRFAYLAALAAPLLAVAPAAAQTATDPSAPSFTGLRVQGLAGWDRTQAYGGHKDGVLYGAGLGYDVQRGGILIGIDGEIDGSTAKDCVGSATAADPRLCAKAGRDLYVGGRVGTLLGARTLLYAKAGYTNARYSLGDNNGTTNVGGSKNFDGLRVGGGLEYALTRNAFVNAEYRYSNYQDGLSRNQVVGGFGVRF